MRTNPVISLIALMGLAHWFFGNLYEEIVLAPNMLANSYQQLQCWQGYFTVTNQIYYYVPFTQLAVLLTGYLYFRNRQQPVRRYLLKASLFGTAAIGLTALIVTQLNLKLFFGDLSEYRNELYTLSVYWLIGNAIRILLVGTALVHTFSAFLTFHSERHPGGLQ